MKKALVASTIVSLIYPAIYALAGRLFVLSNGRQGSEKYKPSITSFYETGIVTSLYEQLLMSPRLSHLEIRHEMPYHNGGKGAPKQVDLWIRPPNGGYAHLIEAGDFSVKKVHADLQKIKILNPKGACWFLSFFREQNDVIDPLSIIEKSFSRKNGLNQSIVKYHKKLCGSFDVYRPDGGHDKFGFALLRAR